MWTGVTMTKLTTCWTRNWKSHEAKTKNRFFLTNMHVTLTMCQTLSEALININPASYPRRLIKLLFYRWGNSGLRETE